MKSAVLITVLGCVLAGDALGQNLIFNGDFASNIHGWNHPDALPSWKSLDADGSMQSGSAYYANTQAAGATRVNVLSQCIPTYDPGVYLMGASGYIPTGQSNGDLVFSYSLFVPSGQCLGAPGASGTFSLSEFGAWQVFSNTTFPLNVSIQPNTPASILLTLGVEKVDVGGSLAGYFDNIYLIRDTLFLDGFE
jgi:hypothetical protein